VLFTFADSCENAAMALRVSIVEDDDRLREEFTRLIESASDMSLVSVSNTGEDALARVRTAQPNVVLMDVNLGDGIDGIECVRRLKADGLEAQVVMLTSFESNDKIFESLSAGATGYVLKRSPGLQILEAVRDVNNGGSPMSAAIARKVVQFFGKSSTPAPVAPSSDIDQLTDRERAVLVALSEGQQYKEIADALGISINTVRKYIKNIYEKLQVNTRLAAVRKLGRV
jgi:DNA-binding NarL/FixJ family response regulator